MLSPVRILHGLGRPVMRLSREVPVWPKVIASSAGAKKRSVAFLPARGRSDGAALLRIHEVAPHLAAAGWRVVVLPWRLTLEQRHRMLGAFGPDVVVMQGARHDLNRPALYPEHAIVYDMDDADFHLPHLAAPVQAAMPDVAAVMAGSRYVADWCRGHGAGEADVIWTSAPVSAAPRPCHTARGAVVAWAQTRPMTYAPEAALVRSIMREVAAVRPGVTLRLYDRKPGDDPGFADSFRAPGLTVEWREFCRYSDYLSSFDDVAIGLAPLCIEEPFHRGKSFGKVLGYLDRSVPVIASPVGEFPLFFTGRNGVLADRAPDWSAAIIALLDDVPRRQAMADTGTAAFRSHLTTDVAAARVATVLARVCERVTAHGGRAMLSA